MNAASQSGLRGRVGDPDLAKRLKRHIRGEVLFDRYSRGRYSTDASIYQIEPVGVVVPRDEKDIKSVISIAAEEQVPLLMRGAGTSQCGQTVGLALVIDVSKYMNQILDLDLEQQQVQVQPGIVLDQLNERLRPHNLFFPVDVSTASRATIGGMSGNNSCGARSIHYGIMRDNVFAIDAYLADGTKMNFGPVQANAAATGASDRYRELITELTLLAERESGEIQSKFPALRRRVGGYNIDELLPRSSPEMAPANIARLLVGSEGTLAISTQITLGLHPIPSHRVLAVCHFDSFYEAMDSTRHIVALNPTAVELVDKTMIELSRDIPMFRKTIDQFVRGAPDALLLVEFAGEDHKSLLLDLKHLDELMADHGFRSRMTAIVDPSQQRALWEVRKAGLNIMMSMKGDGKPISFIEDCAVPLEHLADYTARLTEVFSKHGTTGTWYAHASEGCLHVRPVLNMKDSGDVRKMRAIAEEAFAMVREYKGSHSGEHGDGIVRSEFHPVMFGDRMIRSFESVKRMFDPTGLLNPGKIVDPQKMDDRSLFRYQPDYHTVAPDTQLDWSEWGGIAGAIEMCNNNGACRKRDASVMCPSYRATNDEAHVTRGRANTLRLAISGQLGADALSSDEVAKSMSLCVGCKACKRECPTGVDMARMKLEVTALRAKTYQPSLRDHIIGFLPRYAYYARYGNWALPVLDRTPGLPWLREKALGISRHRRLPRFLSDSTLLGAQVFGPAQGKAVLLLVDTFTYWFEPDNAKAAIEVLIANGYQVHLPKTNPHRPLCCGRTFLSVGMVDQARQEVTRLTQTLGPYLEKGIPVLGLEPSCLLTLRDEIPALNPQAATDTDFSQVMLFEEFLHQEYIAKNFKPKFKPLVTPQVAIHGHCHQKAFDTLPAVQGVLELIPGIQPRLLTSSCCGMAGAFGYQSETYDISMRMAELDLLPQIRQLEDDAVIIANGVSCRQQITHGTGRNAVHVARVLRSALPD